ncbi:MAG: hypothetical protein PVH11_06560 [Anaerolineae bacterium]|jgi:ABC-type transporter Mla subunit MlaD
MKIGQIIIVALVALLTIAVCIVAGILLVRTFSGEATPTAVVEATEAPTLPSDTPET